MKARTGGHVDIKVGMMHSMQAPQQRYPVHQQVLQVNHQIKQ